jgi:hypothetical protein
MMIQKTEKHLHPTFRFQEEQLGRLSHPLLLNIFQHALQRLDIGVNIADKSPLHGVLPFP